MLWRYGNNAVINQWMQVMWSITIVITEFYLRELKIDRPIGAVIHSHVQYINITLTGNTQSCCS